MNIVSNIPAKLFKYSKMAPALQMYPGLIRNRLLKSARRHLPADMIGVIATGRSDFTGKATMRKIKDVVHVYNLFCRYHMLFSCVTLLGVSDEAIALYGLGFRLGLLVSETRKEVGAYQTEAWKIAQCELLSHKEQQKLTRKVYQKYRLRLYTTAYKKAAA